MPPGALLCVLATLLLTLVSARAQNPPIVRAIDVQYVGAPSISKERVMANLATKIGQPYNELEAEQDIRSLYATGGVSNVRMFAEPLGDGVKVTVLLQGRPVIKEIIVEGAGQIPLRRVRKEVDTKVGDQLSEEKLENDRQKILKLYQDRNYSQVEVTYKIVDIKAENRVAVVYTISEGPKMIVRKISFMGNTSILPKDLIKAMKTKPYNLLSFINKSGRLIPDQVDDDKIAIRTLYQNRGFADATVVDVQTTPLPKNGVNMLITVSEGIQYRVHSMHLEGVNVVPVDQVSSRMKMKSGSLFTPKGMGEDLKTLRDFYGVKGYVDMGAAPQVLPAGPGSVDVTYRINEGVQSYVNLVNIQGNTRTKDYVIRRELAVQPGEVFDTTKVDVSKNRLENLNYFSRVDMNPSDTIIPGRKDLDVIVEEKRTGSFNFGAGYSTTDSLVGFAELQQTNFDLFNWPSFIGGGERFRIRGQLGLLRSDFVLALTEPWFLGYKLAVGGELYYHEAAFLSTVYDQSNLGADVNARKQIWGPISGNVEYRIEQVKIFNVSTSQVGTVIQDSAGTYTRSAFTGVLTWDTRDNLFLTHKGELITLNAFIAGGALGGTVQDYGISFSSSKYFSLPWDTILLLKGQVAVVSTWGGSTDVPIFDRLYLGGANDLRGFAFREVGPKDQYGNPIGGNSLAYGTIEYTFPIVTRVRGAIFSDWGYVNPGSYDFSSANLNADIGFGIRLDLPIGPIRIDWGFPVKHDQWNNSQGQFNFNIGYQF